MRQAADVWWITDDGDGDDEYTHTVSQSLPLIREAGVRQMPAPGGRR
jgi:hypothetical protein